VVFTQIAFVGHDAGHRLRVLTANDAVSRDELAVQKKTLPAGSGM
jgi:hypothetical protein